jgi:amino acid adenylation domain-containing protein/non-ribosomal peptide synthase protein (TIGR01720 family)
MTGDQARMDIEELLITLRNLGTSLSVEQGRLRVRAPKGALSDDLYAALATHRDELLRILGRRPAADLTRLRHRHQAGPAPLTHAQQRLWFLDQMHREASYIMPAVLRVRGPLRLPHVKRSLEAVVARHEALRTTFPADGGAPRQRIAERQSLPWVVADLCDQPGQDREGLAQELIQREIRRPFDLAEGPLIRVTAIRLAEDEHLLVLALHHIVSDAWSMRVLIRELGECYAAFSEGRPVDLVPLEAQFADYAVWEQEMLTSEPIDADVAFWRHALEGAPANLELPLDRSYPAQRSGAGGQVTTWIDAALRDRLAAYATARGATSFQAMLAAYATLLHRHGGQDDMVIGVPIATRDLPQTVPLIGYFVTSLPVRITFADDPSFEDLVDQVRTTVLDGLAHLRAPLEMVVDALQPERSLAHSPLFQTMFGLQPAPTALIAATDVELEVLKVHNGTAKFDLTVLMEEHEDGIDVPWEFNVDIFEAKTVQCMAERLPLLLSGLLDHPARPVSRVPLQTDEMRADLLARLSGPTTPYPADTRLEIVFSRQAAATPHAPAVRYGGDTLTYAQLEERSTALAGALQAAGVDHGEPVGVCLPRGVDLIVSILAALKAGGCYVPLSPDDPSDRLVLMLVDSGVRVVVAAEADPLAGALSGADVVVLPPDAVDEQLRARPGSGEDPAYICYTSGSTGTPKGVVVPHRAVARLVHGQDHLAYERGLTFAQVATPSFDAFTMELWGSLLHGGCLVGVDRDVMLDPAAFARQICDDNLQAAFVTASLFNQLVAAQPGMFAPMDTVLVGGEALDPQRIAEVLEAGPPTRLLNGYGPTETTTFAATHLIMDVPPGTTGIPLGRPLSGARLYVLDAHGEPVPPGVQGELFIGGDGLALGYHQRAELTAARFVDDPFAGGAARMYATGDLVSLTADGLVRYHGRRDRQVKVRGHRIELGEVEQALLRIPGVGRAVVTAPPTSAGHRRLVAYVVSEDAGAPVGDLRRQLAGTLPDYMIPARWVSMTALPTTASGKLDLTALPQPDEKEVEPGGHAGDPSGAETILLAVWSEVLGRAGVTAHDNFFALGGDSIQSIQVVARAREAGLHVTPRQVFATASLAELAAVAGTDVVVAEQGVVQGVVPLTPIQRWLFAGDRPEDVGQSLWMLVRPGLDEAALRTAMDALVVRHDALRLRYRPSADGGPPTQVHGPAPGTWELDVTQGEEPPPSDITRGFDLVDGPLLRAHLQRTPSDAPDRLVLAAHHLVVDSVSWGTLVADLVSAYGDAVRGLPPQLLPKTTSFKAWAEHLADLSRTDELLAQRGWWRSQLEGQPAWHPPVERVATHRRSFDVEETDRLLRAPQDAYGVGVHELLLTALAVALAMHHGRDDVAIELEGHGRDDLSGASDLSGTVGWFTAVYPLCVPVFEDPRQALLAVKETLRGVPWSGLGWGLLRYPFESEPTPGTADADLAALPQPDVLFNHLGQLSSDTTSHPGGGIIVGLDPDAPERLGPLTHGLDMVSQVVDGRLVVTCTFASPAWTEESAQHLAAAFHDRLLDLLRHCEDPESGGYSPSDFPLAGMEQSELDDLVAELADAGVDV